MTRELATIVDFIRYGASRFAAAGLTFGHSYDNALDEATHLVLHVLHLPHDLAPAYGQARLVASERAAVLALIERRVAGHEPVAYLTGEAWFAGLKFKSDARALVPRSPTASGIPVKTSPASPASRAPHCPSASRSCANGSWTSNRARASATGWLRRWNASTPRACASHCRAA